MAKCTNSEKIKKKSWGGGGGGNQIEKMYNVTKTTTYAHHLLQTLEIVFLKKFLWKKKQKKNNVNKYGKRPETVQGWVASTASLQITGVTFWPFLVESLLFILHLTQTLWPLQLRNTNIFITLSIFLSLRTSKSLPLSLSHSLSLSSFISPLSHFVLPFVDALCHMSCFCDSVMLSFSILLTKKKKPKKNPPKHTHR